MVKEIITVAKTAPKVIEALKGDEKEEKKDIVEEVEKAQEAFEEDEEDFEKILEELPKYKNDKSWSEE